MNNFSRKGAEEGQLPGSVFTLSFRRFAVLCGVVQLDLSTGALLGGVHDAGVEGARIDMQAHCTLLEVTGIRPGEEVVTTGSFMLKSELLKERIAGDGE